MLFASLVPASLRYPILYRKTLRNKVPWAGDIWMDHLDGSDATTRMEEVQDQPEGVWAAPGGDDRHPKLRIMYQCGFSGDSYVWSVTLFPMSFS